jgi:hypothetical protein
MRRRPLAIAGIALAGLALAGCGEDPAVQQGTVPFSGTNTQPLDPLRNDMQKTMQDRSYLKKSAESGQPAAESKPAVESRPSTGSKPAGESQPAESRPAAETKPSTGSKPAKKGG